VLIWASVYIGVHGGMNEILLLLFFSTCHFVLCRS
jgi:hypothetical protein